MARQGTVVIVGLGRFGAAAALGLARRGADVLAIDIRKHIVQQLADDLPQVVCADGTDSIALKQLGVAQARQVIVAVDSDVEDSMLCTLAVAELKVPVIWAAACSPAHARVLQHLGAHRILMPAHDAAQQAAQHLGGARSWRIRYSGSDFAAAATRITPQIAAMLTGDGLPPGAVAAVKSGREIRAWRPGDALPAQCTILIAGPSGLVQHLVNGGEQ